MEKVTDTEKLRFFREEVKHEFNLLAMRSNILVTCQSFLVVSYAILNTVGDFRSAVPSIVIVAALGIFVALVLTKIVYLNNSTVTGIIDRLEKRELVRRIRISKNRRQVHIEITEEGIKFIKKAPKPIQDQFMDRLIALDEDKIALILWSLEMLVDMLGSKTTTMEILTPPNYITHQNDIIHVEDEIKDI